ncbi:MAG: hypothetical protein QM767_15945 [Anaeromyxobacter sp.]
MDRLHGPCHRPRVLWGRTLIYAFVEFVWVGAVVTIAWLLMAAYLGRFADKLQDRLDERWSRTIFVAWLTLGVGLGLWLYRLALARDIVAKVGIEAPEVSRYLYTAGLLPPVAALAVFTFWVSRIRVSF